MPRPSHKPSPNKTSSDSAETTARTLWSCQSAIDSHSIGPANRCAGVATARSRAFITSSGPCISRTRVSLAVAAIVITSSSIGRLLRVCDGGVVLRRRRADPLAHRGGRGQLLGTHIHHAQPHPIPVRLLVVAMIQPALGRALVPLTSSPLSFPMSRLTALLPAVLLPSITRGADEEEYGAETASNLPEADLHDSPGERAEKL